MAAARAPKTVADKTTEAKISEAPKVAAEPEPETSVSYLDQAAVLAADVRALAEGMREALTEVEARCAEINQTAPEAAAYAAADAVRRIPMSTGDVHRALEGLVHAAADLAAKAQPAEAE